MKKYIISIFVLLVFSSCENCIEMIPLQCGGNENTPLVDLIILIDTSGSMGSSAAIISDASEESIKQASDLCSTDLRVKFLGLDGTFPGTVFDQSHRNYLYDLLGQNIALASDRLPATFLQEQGANAIEDLSNLFDWRENACRAIFYISDEELDGCCPSRVIGGDPVELARETEEVELAINTAFENGVAVFSHLIDSNGLDPAISILYQRLSDETSGLHKKSTLAEVTGNFYVDLLPEVICNSCNACLLNDFINK